MFHMLSCFNLKPGEEIEAFSSAYTRYVDEMKRIGLVENTGAIGSRQSDTPMDTDDERDHEYFVVMSFRDREQVDAAYAHIMHPGGRVTLLMTRFIPGSSTRYLSAGKTYPKHHYSPSP